jgi:hypothetical protein
MYETERAGQIGPHVGAYPNTADSWLEVQVAVVNNLMFVRTGAMAILPNASEHHAIAGTSIT